MADDKTPKKPLTTAKGINELVEQMEANNKSTKNI